MARKQKRLAAADNDRQERRRGHSGPKWPIGEGMQLIVGVAGEPHPTLDDDCPICRALQEGGEPVFTVDALGRLELVSGGGRWT